MNKSSTEKNPSSPKFPLLGFYPQTQLLAHLFHKALIGPQDLLLSVLSPLPPGSKSQVCKPPPCLPLATWSFPMSRWAGPWQLCQMGSIRPSPGRIPSCSSFAGTTRSSEPSMVLRDHRPWGPRSPHPHHWGELPRERSVWEDPELNPLSPLGLFPCCSPTDMLRAGVTVYVCL